MGAVIKAVATARPSRWPLSHGARRLADEAARACLERARVPVDELDLLVNVGVFRERGLGEPALAALIQDDIGTDGSGSRHGTFSFDLDNGACGVLTGAHVVRGFLESGAARYGLVVASDSGPDPVHAQHMPYGETGGALLLTWDEDVPGLVGHREATFPEFEGLAQSVWSWQPRVRLSPHGPTGHNTLLVQEKPGFHARAVDCAAEVVHDFLRAQGVALRDLDLLVATHAPGFDDDLADRLGLAHAKVLHVGEDLVAAHTAAPVVAVAAAQRQGRWDDARTVLLVAASAGISVAASLYRH